MKNIGALLITVLMAAALFAAPALAWDSDDYGHDRWRGGEEWQEHHPWQDYGYSRQPRWIHGRSPYQSYEYRPEPPWNYGQWRYGYNGWRGHHDYDHDGD